jgi:hypothetical protein
MDSNSQNLMRFPLRPALCIEMRVLTGHRRCPNSHDNHAHDLNGIEAETRTSHKLGLLKSDM